MLKVGDINRVILEGKFESVYFNFKIILSVGLIVQKSPEDNDQSN